MDNNRIEDGAQIRRKTRGLLDLLRYLRERVQDAFAQSSCVANAMRHERGSATGQTERRGLPPDRATGMPGSLASAFSAVLLCSLTGTSAQAALPAEISMGTDSWHASVSAKGDVMSIFREDSTGARFERSGKVLVRIGEQVIELPSIPQEGFPKDAPKHTEKVVINPDGRFVLRFARGHVFIQSLPDAGIVWTGTLQYGRHSGDAYYYRATDKRLLISDGSTLLTFQTAGEGPAARVGYAEIAFAGEDPKYKGNYVQTAAFSADGRSLFVGNKDGEVLAIDLDGETPKLRWRIQAFQSFKTRGFNDDANRIAASVKCADNCRLLAVRSFRDKQIAVVSAADGTILGSTSQDEDLGLVGIGDGLFAMTRVERGRLGLSIVDAKLDPVMQIGGTPSLLVFGYSGGFASVRMAREERVVVFTDTDQLLAGHRRQREAEVAERQRRQKEEAVQAEAARQKQVAFEKQLPQFRRKLKSGDDSNCGLVIERKSDIALVETMIGQKWLKVSQLYIPGMRGCTFLNGVLQE